MSTTIDITDYVSRTYWENKIEKRKERIKHTVHQQTKDRFNIRECQGKIYIMCDDVAVYEANEKESSTEITSRLEEMRRTAVAYQIKQEK